MLKNENFVIRSMSQSTPAAQQNIDEGAQERA